jgi:hypothetical protein
MKYKVLVDNGYTFDTLDAAKAFVENIFSKTGIVASIVEA